MNPTMKLRWVKGYIWMRDSDGNERHLPLVLQQWWEDTNSINFDSEKRVVTYSGEWRDIPIESE